MAQKDNKKNKKKTYFNFSICNFRQHNGQTKFIVVCTCGIMDVDIPVYVVAAAASYCTTREQSVYSHLSVNISWCKLFPKIFTNDTFKK